MKVIPITEEFVLLCPKEPSHRVLNRVVNIVDNLDGEEIVVFDYQIKKGSINQYRHSFVNRYSIIERYYNPPYLLLHKRYFQEGVSKHQMVSTALTLGARVKHIPEAYGKITKEECNNMNPAFFSAMGDHHGRDYHYSLMSAEYDGLKGTLRSEFYVEDEVLVIVLSSNTSLLSAMLESLTYCCHRDKMKVVVGWYGDEVSYKKAEDTCGHLAEAITHIDSKVHKQFNFSKFNNVLFDIYYEKAYHEYVLLLNDDLDCFNENFLSEICYIAYKENADIVGCELRYPSDTYQHGGVILGNGTTLFEHFGKNKDVNNFYIPTREVSAVTFAAALINGNTYNWLRLDEEYYGDCNDIDFCLRTRERGGSVWYCSGAKAIHHESATRKIDATMQGDLNSRKYYKENINRLTKEFKYV